MAGESQEKLKKRLEALIKEPHNRFCCDCGGREPRWASANLGVFMCLQCSGIHRNLGVHISFVRSVNLDSWTDKQVKVMEEWGNARGKAFYEAEVDAGYRRPTENASVREMERWIRDKYEHRRFVSRAPPPAAASAANGDAAAGGARHGHSHGHHGRGHRGHGNDGHGHHGHGTHGGKGAAAADQEPEESAAADGTRGKVRSGAGAVMASRPKSAVALKKVNGVGTVATPLKKPGATPAPVVDLLGFDIPAPAPTAIAPSTVPAPASAPLPEQDFASQFRSMSLGSGSGGQDSHPTAAAADWGAFTSSPPPPPPPGAAAPQQQQQQQPPVHNHSDFGEFMAAPPAAPSPTKPAKATATDILSMFNAGGAGTGGMPQFGGGQMGHMGAAPGLHIQQPHGSGMVMGGMPGSFGTMAPQHAPHVHQGGYQSYAAAAAGAAPYPSGAHSMSMPAAMQMGSGAMQMLQQQQQQVQPGGSGGGYPGTGAAYGGMGMPVNGTGNQIQFNNMQQPQQQQALGGAPPMMQAGGYGQPLPQQQAVPAIAGAPGYFYGGSFHM